MKMTVDIRWVVFSTVIFLMFMINKVLPLTIPSRLGMIHEHLFAKELGVDTRKNRVILLTRTWCAGAQWTAQEFRARNISFVEVPVDTLKNGEWVLRRLGRTPIGLIVTAPTPTLIVDGRIIRGNKDIYREFLSKDLTPFKNVSR
jgi:hypothetical protein